MSANKLCIQLSYHIVLELRHIRDLYLCPTYNAITSLYGASAYAQKLVLARSCSLQSGPELGAFSQTVKNMNPKSGLNPDLPLVYLILLGDYFFPTEIAWIF